MQVSFIIYAIVNLYTDIKYRSTKNYWHLIFLILGIFFALNVRTLQEVLLSMFYTLLLGLTLEKMKVSSPGDTKMLTITTIWLASFIPISANQLSIFLILFYILQLSLLGMIQLIRKYGVIKGVKRELHNFKMAVLFNTNDTNDSSEKLINNFPGAVFVYISAFINYILFL